MKFSQSLIRSVFWLITALGGIFIGGISFLIGFCCGMVFRKLRLAFIVSLLVLASLLMLAWSNGAGPENWIQLNTARLSAAEILLTLALYIVLDRVAIDVAFSLKKNLARLWIAYKKRR